MVYFAIVIPEQKKQDEQDKQGVVIQQLAQIPFLAAEQFAKSAQKSASIVVGVFVVITFIPLRWAVVM